MGGVRFDGVTGSEQRWPRWRWTAFGLCALVLVTFFPLAAAKNFLPFARYPGWGLPLALGSGQSLEIDRAHLARARAFRGIQEPEFGSIGVQWSMDAHAAGELHRGRLPLWNPYIGNGAPTIDNGQFRPFNPMRWLYYAFPSTASYCATLVLGLVIGMAGAHRFLRSSGLSPAASALGAAAFSLNPWCLERLVILDTAAYFFLPWCLLGLERIRWERASTVAAGAVPFVLMGHAGQPEVAALMACAAALHYLAFGGGRGSGPSLSRRAGAVAAVAILTVLCLSILWAPMLRLYFNGQSYKGMPVQFQWPYQWDNLFALASELLVVPALAASAVAAAWSRGRSRLYWMSACALGALVLMPLPGLGHALADAVHGATRMPVYYLKSLFWAGLAFTAARGFDALLELEGNRWLAPLSAGLLVLGLECAVLAQAPLPAKEQSAHPWAFFLLAGLGLAALAGSRLVPCLRRHPEAAALGIALPLAFPISLNHLAWNRLEPRPGPLVEWLRRQRPQERVVSLGSPAFAIPPNLCEAMSVRCAEHVAAIFPNRFFEAFHQGPFPTCAWFEELDLQSFRQLGATILLARSGSQSLELLADGGPFSAYAIPGGRGRLFWAERVAPFDPRRPVLGQTLALGAGDGAAAVEGIGPAKARALASPGPLAKAELAEDEAHSVALRASTPVEALLVLRDTWYPGWEATVDGVDVPIYRVNGNFRGLVVPAGEHLVRFVYRPRTVYAAGAVSALSTGAMLVLAALRRWGRQAASRAPPSP
ncbi:MAG: hypothetical protein HYZ28_28930 [Myxococcales bacterium]|nr:hypothetical protein [Myxococcales bacterium]